MRGAWFIRSSQYRLDWLHRLDWLRRNPRYLIIPVICLVAVLGWYLGGFNDKSLESVGHDLIADAIMLTVAAFIVDRIVAAEGARRRDSICVWYIDVQ
jgi:hypothetical protein